MFTPAVDANFCFSVLSTTSWPSASSFAALAASPCALVNCCVKFNSVPLNGEFDVPRPDFGE